jgi:hypothetical protein
MLPPWGFTLHFSYEENTTSLSKHGCCANIAKNVARMLLSIEYLSWLELAE